MSDMEINAPERFVCPISMVVMTHPVRTESGHVFERRAIMEWIYFGKATCPLSRKPLHPSRFVRDTRLELEIKQWRLENDFPAAAAENEDDEDIPRMITIAVPKKATNNDSHKANHLLSLRDKVLKNRDRRVASYTSARRH